MQADNDVLLEDYSLKALTQWLKVCTHKLSPELFGGHQVPSQLKQKRLAALTNLLETLSSLLPDDPSSCAFLLRLLKK